MILIKYFQISIFLWSMFQNYVHSIVTGNIRIVGIGGPQFFPGSYVNTFPRWLAEETTDGNINLSRILGSGLDRSDKNVNTIAQQFVDPTSNSEVWWPADIATLQARPTLDVLIKSSVPTYVFGGIELKVPSFASKDGREWKNFGMNCQPIANQWTSFSLAVEAGFRVETFYGQKLMQSEDSSIIEWKELHQNNVQDAKGTLWDKEEFKEKAAEQTQKALSLLGSLLANLNEHSPFADGMHILSIPVGAEWVDLPNIEVGTTPSDSNDYHLVSIATVESDAKELLQQDDDIISMSGCSMLNVNVQRVSPGQESEFMPEVYQPLYIG
jgi:hypothetical protein